jgi:Ca-activated chloride channel family protein
MRFLSIFFILLSSLSVGQETYRVNTNLVNLSFSARDSGGVLVGNVVKEDLEVFDDGVPQKISYFSRSMDVPLTLGLIVDVSGSQQHFYKQHHRDLEIFLKDVLGSRDRAFLVCFGNHLRLASDFSYDVPELLDRLREVDKQADKGERIFPEIGPAEDRELGTAFFDSIYYSITEKLASQPGRRALVIFSDGEDNSSSHDLMTTIEASQAQNIPVFTVRYTQRDHGRLTARNRYGIRVMERIAVETGGREFDARAMDPHDYFKEIADELRSSYELGYYPSHPLRDNTFHKVAVRGKNRELTIRCRTGYFSR